MNVSEEGKVVQAKDLEHGRRRGRHEDREEEQEEEG